MADYDILQIARNREKKIATKDVVLGTTYGMFIGLSGGLLWAYFQDKKYLTSSIVGTVTGGLLALLIVKK